MTTFSHTQQSSRGIGSVELVLALVMVFFGASAGVNWVKSQFEDGGKDEKLRNLAAEVVAVSEAASLAGIDLVDEAGVENTLDRIERGATAKSEHFKGQHYSVSGLTEDLKTRVSEYLRINFGKLEVIPPKPAD